MCISKLSSTLDAFVVGRKLDFTFGKLKIKKVVLIFINPIKQEVILLRTQRIDYV